MRSSSTAERQIWLLPLVLGAMLASCSAPSSVGEEHQVSVPPPGANLPELLEEAQVARTATVLVLSEGTYEAQIVSRAAVTLRGAGPGRTILAYAGKEPAVWGGQAAMTLRDLTVRPKGEGPAIVGGDIELENVEVIDSGSDGVYVVGGRARLKACVIQRAKQNGVFAIQGARVEIDQCRISFCQGNGVWLREDSHGEIRDSDVRRCEFNGIAVSGPGALKVSRSSCVLNKNAGLAAFRGGVLEAEQCLSQDNDKVGIAAEGGAEVKLTRCRVSWNRQHGVVANSSSRLFAEGCTLYANTRDSVLAMDGGVVTLRRSILMGEGPESASRGIVLVNEGNDKVGGITLDTNDVFYFNEPFVGVVPDAKTFAADPIFLDPGANDHRLHPTSPCVLAEGHLGALPPLTPEEAERAGVGGVVKARRTFESGLRALADSDLARAGQQLREAVELDPRYIPPMVELGETLRRLGRHQEALGMSAKAVRADWLNVYGYYGLESHSSELGRQDLMMPALHAVDLVKAVARIRRNHKVDEMDALAALNLLGASVLLGKDEVFEKEIAIYVRRFPEKAAAFGGEKLLVADSEERKAFRAAAVTSVTRLWGLKFAATPFRVEHFEAETTPRREKE